MFWLSWLLNLPYTFLGVFFGICSLPRGIRVMSTFGTPVFVIRARTLRWIFFFPRVKGVTVGSTILLAPLADQKILAHELVHVEQFLKVPILFPALYWLELLRHGYRLNKYEVEAYTRAGNQYGPDV